MKFLIVVILIFCIEKSVSNGWSASDSQCYARNQLLTSDTIVPHKTINDAIEKINFKGIIILNDKRISYNDPFLDKPIQKNLIKEVTILKYLPMDSVLKYGNRGNFGMLKLKTR